MTSQAVEGTWQPRSQDSLLPRGKRENPGNELAMWIHTGGYGANGLRKKIEKTDKSVFVSPQKIPTVQVIFIATSTSHST